MAERVTPPSLLLARFESMSPAQLAAALKSPEGKEAYVTAMMEREARKRRRGVDAVAACNRILAELDVPKPSKARRAK